MSIITVFLKLLLLKCYTEVFVRLCQLQNVWAVLCHIGKKKVLKKDDVNSMNSNFILYCLLLFDIISALSTMISWLRSPRGSFGFHLCFDPPKDC